MAYDPRQMMAIGRMGIGMMAPEPSPFQQQQQPRRAPEWWEQPLPQRKDQPADQSADPSQDPNAPKAPPRQPPSLLDMMMGLGRMTRPEYDRAIREPGAYGVPPKDAARASPWAFLGSLGSGGPPR
jgi:hypothetical protein